MEGKQIVTLIFLVAFVAIMVGIGLLSMKRTKTVGGFLLGGRKMGAWMSAFAYGTSYFSAVLFIGYAGKNGWNIGISGAWIGIGNAILGSFLAWKILAKRTRRMTHRLDAKTMPEFFESRYQSKGMKIFTACVIFIFLVPYSASVYMGLGYLFDAAFPGVSYDYCMIFIAVVTAAYLVMGGYVATAVNDFVQGIIMIVGVILMVVAIIMNPAVGGLSGGLQKLEAVDPNLASIFGGENWKTLLTMIMLTSFGTWGLPQMVHKYYAVKDERSISKAMIISTIFALLISASAYFVGSFGRLYLNNTLPEGGYDAVMPSVLVQALSGGAATQIIFNVILVLVLSASMSTLASIVLTSSSAISIDLVKGFFCKNMQDKSSLRLTRLLCLLFVGVSLIIAMQKPAIIITLMSFSWGTVSGAFIGPFLWGLYSKRITKAGAWTGMLAGFLCSVLCMTISGFNEALSPLFGVISMAISLVVTPVASCFGQKYDAAFLETVFVGQEEKMTEKRGTDVAQ